MSWKYKHVEKLNKGGVLRDGDVLLRRLVLRFSWWLCPDKTEQHRYCGESIFN